MNRLKAVVGSGTAALRKVVEEDTELLAHFGFRVLSYDLHGVRGCLVSEVGNRKKIDPWHLIELDPKVWGWLHPLLVAARGVKAAGHQTLLKSLPRESVRPAQVEPEEDTYDYDKEYDDWAEPEGEDDERLAAK